MGVRRGDGCGGRRLMRKGGEANGRGVRSTKWRREQSEVGWKQVEFEGGKHRRHTSPSPAAPH